MEKKTSPNTSGSSQRYKVTRLLPHFTGESGTTMKGLKKSKKRYVPFIITLSSLFDALYIPITKGCLQNELIMYTLAHAHFAEYEDIPDPSDLHASELPGGALILAMQAVSFTLRLTCQQLAKFYSFFSQVEHAFKFWKSGEFVEDKSSHFSADNYGDTVKRKVGPDGRIKDMRVLNAGRYKPTIRSLSVVKHWVPIFNNVAHILTSTRKKKARSKSASSRASSEIFIDETPEYILV